MIFDSPNMIFYFAGELGGEISSASRLRPVKMLAAFRECGATVSVVSGDFKERAIAIKAIRDRINSGEKFDFMYGEGLTSPTALSGRHHLPLRPTQERAFFKSLNTAGIPIGYFYRDIHWCFSFYGLELPRWKKRIALWFYRFELKYILRYSQSIFLPSKVMAEYMPGLVSTQLVSTLPPGCEVKAKPKSTPILNPIKLIYVGGVSEEIYNLKDILVQIRKERRVKLKLCIRKHDWAGLSDEYQGLCTGNISLVWEDDQDLLKLYKEADVALCFFGAHVYHQFAVPYKLYEAIGYGLPILAKKTSQSGQVVEKLQVGWTLAQSTDFSGWVEQTLALGSIEQIWTSLKVRQQDQTWRCRAESVINQLIDRNRRTN